MAERAPRRRGRGWLAVAGGIGTLAWASLLLSGPLAALLTIGLGLGALASLVTGMQAWAATAPKDPAGDPNDTGGREPSRAPRESRDGTEARHGNAAETAAGNAERNAAPNAKRTADDRGPER